MNRFTESLSKHESESHALPSFVEVRPKSLQEIRYFPNPRLFNPPDTWNRGFLGSSDNESDPIWDSCFMSNPTQFIGKRVNIDSEAFKDSNGPSTEKKLNGSRRLDFPSNQLGQSGRMAWPQAGSNFQYPGEHHPATLEGVSKPTDGCKWTLLNEQASTQEGNLEDEEKVQPKIDTLLLNKEESDKAILKVLLYEVIINEKVNKQRISFLPNQVVELLQLFLKKHYGFCLENASKVGTARKYLYLLRNEGYELEKGDGLLIESFRFRFQLYMYGVKKKIPRNPSKLGDDYYVTKTLFDKIYPRDKYSEESLAIKLSHLWCLVQMTFSKDSVLTLEAIKAWLPKALLPKLLSFNPELLSKYYSIRLRKYLKGLFDGQDVRIAVLRERIKSSAKIPLLSDLLHDPGLKSVLERRKYHLGPCLELG